VVAAVLFQGFSVLVHPRDRLVVPVLGLFLLPLLSVSHGQEERVEAFEVVLQELHRLGQGCDGHFPMTRAMLSHTQGVPVVAFPSCHLDGLLSQLDCLSGIAGLARWAYDQRPRAVVVCARLFLPGRGALAGCAVSTIIRSGWTGSAAA